MAQCIGGLLNFNSSIKVDVSEADDNVWEVEMADDNYAEGAPASITVFVAPPEALTGAMGQDPLSTFKSKYMGSTKPSEKQVTRSFFGHPCNGQMQEMKVDRKKVALEVYLVPAPPPFVGPVFIGLRRFAAPNASATKEERFFDEFCSSLAVKK